MDHQLNARILRPSRTINCTLEENDIDGRLGSFVLNPVILIRLLHFLIDRYRNLQSRDTIFRSTYSLVRKRVRLSADRGFLQVLRKFLFSVIKNFNLSVIFLFSDYNIVYFDSPGSNKYEATFLKILKNSRRVKIERESFFLFNLYLTIYPAGHLINFSNLIAK